MIQLVDTHCHLDGEAFDADRAPVIERARAAGVDWMVAVGTGDGPPDLETGIRLAEEHPFIYATLGVHPHDAAKANVETWAKFVSLASHPKCVAIGEIGLDYHYNFSPPETQREVFARQLELACELRKPIVIHTREAWQDTLSFVRERLGSSGFGGIFHCFSGGPREAADALDLDFHISFSGIVTFPKATAVHEAAKIVPSERLLIETDAPYLAPVPHRGKRAEPAHVAETARKIAALRETAFEEIASITTANAWRLLLAASPCAQSRAGAPGLQGTGGNG